MKSTFVLPCGRVSAIIVLTSGMILGADWRPVNSGLPVTVAGVGVLTVDPKTPSTVYATTAERSVFKTTDSGGSWKQISSVTEVGSLIIDPTNPSTLYAATWHGVVKSLDGGDTWTVANGGLPNWTKEWTPRLVADPRTPSTLYALTGFYNGATLFKSTDGAETWNPVAAKFYASAEATIPLAGAAIHESALVIDPKNSSTMYAPVYDGWRISPLFKSTDGGSTWYPTSIPPSYAFQVFPVFDPVNLSTIYLGYSLDDATQMRKAYFLKSTDDGASWNAIGAGFPANSYLGGLAIDPTTSSVVYATHDGGDAGEIGWGVVKSTDGGQTFTKLDTGLTKLDTRLQSYRPYYGSEVAISPTSPSTVYAAYADFRIRRGRLVKSQDAGVSWNAADAGLTRIDVRALAMDPTNASTVYAGMGGGGEGVFKSVDSGATWSKLAQLQISSTRSYFYSPPFQEPGAVHSLLIDFANPSILYAGTTGITGRCSGNSLFKSTDGGLSWSDIAKPLYIPCWSSYFQSVFMLDPADPDDLYVGGFEDTCGTAGLEKSSDGGLDWKFLRGWDSLNALAIDPTYATLYAATGEGVLKSTNGGMAWTKTGLNAGVSALAIDRAKPSTMYAATGGSYTTPGFRGMFKSFDGGENWASIDNGLARVIDTRSPVTALAIAPDRAIYAATSGHGVYKSSDLGASWNPFNAGLTNLDVRVLTVSSKAPNTLYAVTPGGTFTIIDEVK